MSRYPLPRAVAGRPAAVALVSVSVLIAIELVAISLLYQHAFEFECRAKAPALLCGGLSAGVIRALGVAGAVATLVMARPAMRAALLDGLRATPSTAALAAQLAGFALVIAPWFFLDDASSGGTLAAAFGMWGVGVVLAGGGTLLAVAPLAAWRAAATAAGVALPFTIAAGALAPEAGAAAQFLWRVAPINEATFAASAALLGALGEDVVVDPSIYMIAVRDFPVLVGRQCSGIEGFALISMFVSLYLWLFRSQLRFPRALLLLPIGIAASWTLNVVRIVMLIQIGAHVSPDLAVNGFHSHAGWLMFTILAVSTVLVAHNTPWLRRRAGAAIARPAPPPLAQDWNAARLLPFIVFMASALLSSTFHEVPGVLYPARFVACVAALAVFRGLYLALDWRIDPVAVGAGLGVGVLWIATDPTAGEATPLTAALAAMPAWLFAIWATTRILGTSFVVPLVEELVFRSYVMERADPGGRFGWLAALAISTAAFAALHDRWLAAALAGVVFALVARRAGRLAPAIHAHMAANSLIAGWALATGGWEAI